MLFYGSWLTEPENGWTWNLKDPCVESFSECTPETLIGENELDTIRVFSKSGVMMTNSPVLNNHQASLQSGKLKLQKSQKKVEKDYR